MTSAEMAARLYVRWLEEGRPLGIRQLAPACGISHHTLTAELRRKGEARRAPRGRRPKRGAR